MRPAHPNTPTCGERLLELMRGYWQAGDRGDETARKAALREYLELCEVWGIDVHAQTKSDQARLRAMRKAG